MGTEEELHNPVHLPYQYCAHALKPVPQQEAVPPDQECHQTVRQAVVGDVARGQDGENQDVGGQHPALQQESLPPDRVDHQALRQAFLPSLKQLDKTVTMGTGEERSHNPKQIPCYMDGTGGEGMDDGHAR